MSPVGSSCRLLAADAWPNSRLTDSPTSDCRLSCSLPARYSRFCAAGAGGAMARYILGRLLGLVFVLFAVSLITFLLTRAVPGDPFASGERELPEATQIARAAKYGFDQPILVQYGRYIWNVLHGDFGVPFQSPSQTVVDLIKQTWPVTLHDRGADDPHLLSARHRARRAGGAPPQLLDRLRRHVRLDAGHGGAELRGRHLADPPLQRRAGLVADRRVGQSRPPRAAGDRLLTAADGARRALHPGQPAGEPGRGPRPHGAGKGTGRAPGAGLACRPQRADPVRDDHDPGESRTS